MGFVADDGYVAAVHGMKVKPLGDFVWVVLWQQAGDFHPEGVDQEQAGGEIVCGLARASEGAVPDVSGTEHAAG
ncbi:MAG: hypothetical protein RLZZ50_360, partial [Verrucomicrobiota bacterium]